MSSPKQTNWKLNYAWFIAGTRLVQGISPKHCTSPSVSGLSLIDTCWDGGLEKTNVYTVPATP